MAAPPGPRLEMLLGSFPCCAMRARFVECGPRVREDLEDGSCSPAWSWRWPLPGALPSPRVSAIHFATAARGPWNTTWPSRMSSTSSNSARRSPASPAAAPQRRWTAPRCTLVSALRRCAKWWQRPGRCWFRPGPGGAAGPRGPRPLEREPAGLPTRRVERKGILVRAVVSDPERHDVQGDGRWERDAGRL